MRSGGIAQLHAGLLFALEEVEVQVQISPWLLAGFFSFFFFFNIVFYFLAYSHCRPILASRDFCDKVFLFSNFGPLQRMSRMTKHVIKAGKVDPGVRVTLPVKFACKPELTLTGLLE